MCTITVGDLTYVLHSCMYNIYYLVCDFLTLQAGPKFWTSDLAFNLNKMHLFELIIIIMRTQQAQLRDGVSCVVSQFYDRIRIALETAIVRSVYCPEWPLREGEWFLDKWRKKWQMKHKLKINWTLINEWVIYSLVWLGQVSIRLRWDGQVKLGVGMGKTCFRFFNTRLENFQNGFLKFQNAQQVKTVFKIFLFRFKIIFFVLKYLKKKV